MAHFKKVKSGNNTYLCVREGGDVIAWLGRIDQVSARALKAAIRKFDIKTRATRVVTDHSDPEPQEDRIAGPLPIGLTVRRIAISRRTE